MLCPPHDPAPLVVDWLDRHRNPQSLVLHVIGIPLTILGVLLFPFYLALWSWRVFAFAVAAFVGGYLVQFLGHALEGSIPGEIVALRGWSRRRLASRKSVGKSGTGPVPLIPEAPSGRRASGCGKECPVGDPGWPPEARERTRPALV